MKTTPSTSTANGGQRGGVARAARPMLLATFAKAELVQDVPDITPHIHASQAS
ncbi:hypothetical protein [Nocardia otitidiscaviarum]|uniref:hypothetical protein n=1 Tax=Nocardia otitidiscaviarum TaxID=1823 RepID=UPI001893FD94|nr:hypothetical protein [Nocardia otitidiscaviarum]MBF6183382.1 hypothetical protein [Nocardia otitidiscaviarum]